MKKLFLFTISTVIVTSACVAQITAPVRQKTVIKTAPPPPATNKTTGTTTGNQTTPVYSLTAVRANIRTGHDNKEYPSSVITSFAVRGSWGVYSYFGQSNLKSEMKSNSNTEFGLEKITRENLKDLTLDVLQTTGIEFRIHYSANFQLDAWKIEAVSVTLEFRDQFGNLHPTFGQKTIIFSNANGYLNGYDGTRIMNCHADGYFNPLSSFLQ